jgi:uncharacterized protein YcbK (DUF882 family)
MGDISANFSRSEFECQCGCGFNTVDIELVKLLEKIRSNFGNKSIHINSGNRCEAHNSSDEVKGSKNSQHIKSRAADIFIMTVPPKEIAKYIDSKWPNKYGVGVYNSFTHIDTRSNGPARWG